MKDQATRDREAAETAAHESQYVDGFTLPTYERAMTGYKDGFLAGKLHERQIKSDEVRELVDAANSFRRTDDEYQADKDDGPFMMVYQKWIAEKKVREERLDKALAKFQAATKGESHD